jgi:hypothetical protein
MTLSPTEKLEKRKSALKCFKNLMPCSHHPIEEKKNKTFVLMPFDEAFNEVYRTGIKRGLKEIGWMCDRSDERWDTPEVICTICKSIQEASLIIVDVTGKKPNVFLELGLSFGLEKNILLITQDFDDLSFDLKTFRTIKYDPLNLEKLQRDLQKAIEKIKPIAKIWEEMNAFKDNVAKYRSDLKNYQKPMMQIFIGSKNSRVRWLEASTQNEGMLRVTAPRVILYQSVEAYPNFYKFTLPEKEELKYLRVFPDGFIVSHFPCNEWAREENRGYIHELIQDIAEFFTFASLIMKYKNVKETQRIKIEIYAKNLVFRFDPSPTYGMSYIHKFGETPVIIEEDFNPRDEWKSFFETLIKLYQKVCAHMAIHNIEDKTIRKNLCKLLRNVCYGSYQFNNTTIPGVPLDELCKKVG